MDFARLADGDLKLLATSSEESKGRWAALVKSDITSSPTDEAELLTLRAALLDFIADFANWDNSTSQPYLETSRALTQAAHESLGGEPGSRPLVVDPFAGGGAIPLEALRVGANAFASDLNPVAALINKVVLEYIPKHGKRLSDEVRKWGAWIKTQAEQELGDLYPPDPDGSTPIAYLWARTIKCEGPGCGAEVPLTRSLWLAKKGEKSVALRFIPKLNPKQVDCEILEHVMPGDVGAGTMQRSSATCPVCGYTTPASRVRSQFKERKGGTLDAKLLAVVLKRGSESGRGYRIALPRDGSAVSKAQEKQSTKQFSKEITPLAVIPDEPLPYLRSIFNIRLLGVEEWGQLFTPRQALSISTFARLVREAPIGGTVDEISAIRTLLAFAVDKYADLGNSLCTWEPIAQCPRHLFGRQAIGIVWDFAEANSLGQSSGSWEVFVEGIASALERLGSDWLVGHVEQADAACHPLPDDSASLFVTDPPYYDAVPYADLSDFFYVWLKRTLGALDSSPFNGLLTPKKEEIVQLSERNPQYAYKTKENFESRMRDALQEGRRYTVPSGIGVVVFAHKTTEAWESVLKAVLDAGWTIVASWPIDTENASRLRAQTSAALGSSIHLVCRPRELPDGTLLDIVGEWRDVLSELPERIHDWMPRLAKEGVVGADAIFACLGPALEIFSRFSRVEKASGEQATLREYLEHVWAAVSTEALSMIFADADAAGLEPDARLTAMWLWTLGGGSEITETDGNGHADDLNEVTEESDNEDSEKGSGKTAKVTGYILEFDTARKIAQGLGIHLEKSESIVEVKGDKARLRPVSERMQFLFGKDAEAAPSGSGKKKSKVKQKTFFDELDETQIGEAGWGEIKGPPPGSTVLDRLHQAMILFAAGRGELLKRFLTEDGVGTDARFWKLAQSFSALYPRGSDEKRWVDGVLARKKGLGL